MILRHRNRSRRGASLVEAAIIIAVFLLLSMGTIDLGTAVFRWHVLSQAARQGARVAAVHGQYAPSGWNGGSWGPSTFGPVAASSSDSKAQAVAKYLTGMDPSAVNVTFEWPDGSNHVEKRVRVTVSTTWTPLVLGFISTQTLSASSMMPIAH